VSVSGPLRESAFGERRRLTPQDRLNTWVSGLAVRRGARLDNSRFADFGCGHEARFARSVLDRVSSATLVDLAIAPEVRRHPKVTAIEGPIESVAPTIPSASLDVVVCLSVLEHLARPQDALNEFHRMLAPRGRLLVNVPSWIGKPVLELMAFRLGLSPREEIDDHRHYFNPRDLWPMLVTAGFHPSNIRCRWYKLGLCTFAVCTVPADE
jgi:SAM-dependent methyltransferase